jgi:hypothetical protein
MTYRQPTSSSSDLCYEALDRSLLATTAATRVCSLIINLYMWYKVSRSSAYKIIACTQRRALLSAVAANSLAVTVTATAADSGAAHC